MGVHPLLGIFDGIPAPLLICPVLVKRNNDHRKITSNGHRKGGFNLSGPQEIAVRTLDDLGLKDNEREAIREATRMLKEKFPVKKVSFLAPRHGVMITLSLILICSCLQQGQFTGKSDILL